ncbi:MAG: periplasmic Cu(I)/Cu(II)-binding protein CopK [Herbaspirillum sp.]
MLKKMLMVAAISTVAVSAFANDVARAEAKQAIDLKDGSTVYVFKDGKMAMENMYGNATRMGQNAAMQTKDGQKVLMQGDEVARLDYLLRQGHEGG